MQHGHRFFSRVTNPPSPDSAKLLYITSFQQSQRWTFPLPYFPFRCEFFTCQSASHKVFLRWRNHFRKALILIFSLQFKASVIVVTAENRQIYIIIEFITKYFHKPAPELGEESPNVCKEHILFFTSDRFWTVVLCWWRLGAEQTEGTWSSPWGAKRQMERMETGGREMDQNDSTNGRIGKERTPRHFWTSSVAWNLIGHICKQTPVLLKMQVRT